MRAGGEIVAGEDSGSWAEARLAYLEGIVDGLGAVVWEWDEQRRCYTYVSDGAEKLLGFPCEEWLKPGFWESRLHPAEAERILARAHDSCMAGVPDSDEYRMVHRDGRSVWVRDILSDPGEAGVRDSISGLLVDITETAVARERLAAQAHEFDEVFRVTGDLYFLVDDADLIVDYKAPAGVLYAPPDQFLGQRMTDVLPPELHHMVDSNLTMARETQTMVVTEYELPIRGRRLFWEARFLPIGEGRVAVVSRDVTERHEAAEQLAQSRERYRTLVDMSPYAICVVSMSRQIVFANAATARMIGAAGEAEATGLCVDDMISSEERDGEAFSAVRRLAEDIRGWRPGDPLPKAPPARIKLHTLAGAAIDVEWTCAGILFRGEPSILAIARDITDELRAERQIAESDERFRKVVENAPFGIHLYEMQDGQLVFVGGNPSADAVLGTEHASLIGMTIEEAFPGLAETDVPRTYRSIATEGGSRHTDEIVYDHDQIAGAFEVTAFRIGAGRVAVTFRDITERKIAERNERRYAERLAAMAAELTITEDRERRRLAEELHDRVSQSLAVARMHLTTAEQNPEARTDELRVASGFIETSIAEVRSVTTQLAPPILYELGLGAALAWQCEDLESLYGLRIHLAVGEDETGVTDDAKMLLFRASRELLINVAKYATTHEAWMSLDSLSTWLVLTVEDKGAGFDPARTIQGRGDSGFGLFSIRERLPHLGGEFELESAPGKGTRVTLRVPREAG